MSIIIIKVKFVINSDKGMSMSRNIFMVAIIFTMVVMNSQAQAGRVNITEALLEQPEMMREIRNICKKICIGNERKSWLKQAQVDILEGTYSIADVQIRLRNRHIWHIFGERVQAYSDHSTLKVKVRLHNETCEASVLYEELEFSNTLYKVTFWLTRQLDKLFNFLPAIKQQLPIC